MKTIGEIGTNLIAWAEKSGYRERGGERIHIGDLDITSVNVFPGGPTGAARVDMRTRRSGSARLCLHPDFVK